MSLLEILPRINCPFDMANHAVRLIKPEKENKEVWAHQRVSTTSCDK
jgi:hypothetical protein